MQLAIRTDANELIGAGHLMRCLELAKTLAVKNIQIRFIVKESDLAINLLVNQIVTYLKPSVLNNGLEETNQILKENNIKNILIDHYEIGLNWEKKVVADYVIIIDDLANRAHYCNLLIDTASESRLPAYKKLVPKHCELLLGPKYGIIRDEFIQKLNDEQLSFDIFICFGASDPLNNSFASISELGIKQYKGKICLITGLGYEHGKTLKKLIENTNLNITWHQAPRNLASLMRQSKVIITAPGIMLFEAASMGKSIIMIKTAENQNGNIELFELNKAAILTTISNIYSCIQTMEDKSKTLALKAKAISDGKGKYRIAHHIKQNSSLI
ncbi:UDP-2,4-diacetamido-2,4,6-trideoxy-beta-L-altropyranose hydrolase [Pseudoalteromonas sp. SG45-5]|uniref:UDP-2,4-diacetamido-2,4, 6-trideoxy-beta-L-altropyranose hydrolase n=1 Tax=unclassified Pseudoalteromonas TaxID=194690 RepID=UPI0015FBFADE|nr:MULTISPECIES: UDP-2,4-diacetamido-2,4,6-trideoxy-beta-L-altropyranose hydrolase [unclassified Pseudoalteromonas]MBB1384239.1 UDP-2,4-diacetamido-2,4,6-trideoxy-beta-L-altropyranose hydrolase [Pseudoalteromonas sp. SG45-5]MBB1392541.1 UDP-2,4-diacetamido-2,4,6-trideoxy-beta-L-altropyranose hydrolase [Pseudoalteromonas sp. SG44-4]MBB1448898.1 UDP-2,4-diacetamido-2,4,6-trideoxy-beta-L-altropyranose hydrolase [Pseudoalteromonas sp. SG41-6]